MQAASPTSFANCTGGGAAAPNASDPCWIRGFYTAVLGPDAAKSTGWKVAGVPLDDLVRFWEAPFASDDPQKGGCPPLPVPPRDTWTAKYAGDAGGSVVEDGRGSGAVGMSARQRRKRAFAQWWAARQQADEEQVSA